MPERRVSPLLVAPVLLLLFSCSDYSRRQPAWTADDALLIDIQPLDGARLSSRFGWRERHPILRRPAFHAGIDWAAPTGTPVRAAADGTVVAVHEDFGAYGHYLRIDHVGSVQSVYAHLSRFASGMSPGRRVRKGEVIGRVGRTGRATGPHLHFELHVAGQPIDPLRAASYALAAPIR